MDFPPIDQLPNVPQFVLRMIRDPRKDKEIQNNDLNLIINTLRDSKFEFSLFKSIQKRGNSLIPCCAPCKRKCKNF